eukprot:TRINITY_DN4051_c0_g4_i1.p1 TRINITY_DN4051_c0_g4~~TRINITY_DN4051_c0_g4_i1.p1  ORF type:complete len:365 (+),score=54.60 TRINITY_DN4051_c0_g4_i1:141-1235(+)
MTVLQSFLYKRVVALGFLLLLFYLTFQQFLSFESQQQQQRRTDELPLSHADRTATTMILKRVYLFSVFNTMDLDLEMIPHFVTHYHGLLGIPIENFRIVLHTRDVNGGAFSSCLSKLQSFGIEPYRVTNESFDLWTFPRHYNALMTNISHEDWVVPVDMDEIYWFPDANLGKFVASLERDGYSFAAGLFVDRVSSNGALTFIQPSPSLFEQYPLECQLWQISHAIYQKVIVHRGYVRVSAGHHAIHQDLRATNSEDIDFNFTRGHPTPLPVYHFKWSSSVLYKLPARILQHRKLRLQSQVESENLDQFIRSHGLSICLSCLSCREGVDPTKTPPESLLNPLFQNERNEPPFDLALQIFKSKSSL